jgi:hypothetical protein
MCGAIAKCVRGEWGDATFAEGGIQVLGKRWSGDVKSMLVEIRVD